MLKCTVPMLVCVRYISTGKLCLKQINWIGEGYQLCLLFSVWGEALGINV